MPRLTPIALSLLAISAGIPIAQAQAQAQAPAPATDQAQLESVVITGTRITNPNNTAISPVSSVDRESIEMTRAQNVERVVNQLPQLQGSFGQVSNGNDSRGAATLDLRNLNQNRTLVLVNGKRGAPFGFRNSFDVNSIPAPLVRRIDVLTGGAAAVYGADAVAGVVNFVLNDRFSGLQASATLNMSGEGDAGENGANILYGLNFGTKGNFTAYAGVSKRDRLLKADRDFANPEQLQAGPRTARPIGGQFARADGASVFTVGGVAGQPRFSFSDTGTLSSAVQTSILTPRENLILPAERFNLGAFFNYDILADVKLYGQAIISQTKVEERQAPANGAFSFLLRRDNPFITPQLASVLSGAYNLNFAGTGPGTDAMRVTVSRSLAELGDRVLSTDRSTNLLQIGVKGGLGNNATWDLYAQYGRTTEDTTITGDGILARVAQAAEATTVGGSAACVNTANNCVPINLFGPNSISAAGAAFLAQTVQQDRLRTQFILGGTLNTSTQGLFSLPGGPIDLVLGFEHRKEKGQANFDDNINNGLTINQGRRLDFGGPLTATDVFAEARLPLLRKFAAAEALDLELAYRAINNKEYSDANASKLGIDWTVVNGFRLRGSQQTVVRAPNIGERYGVRSSVALAGRTDDPCRNPSASGADPSLCAANGAPAPGYALDLTGAQFFFGGSPTIKPEEGKTRTFGFVVTPPNLKGFSASVDVYDIKIDNAISAYGAAVVTNGCFVLRIQQFCNRITRGSNGQISAVDSTDSNIARLAVKGYDVGLNYRFKPDFMPGHLSIAYNAEIASSITQQQAPGSLILQCAGKFGASCGLELPRAVPKYKHRLAMGWNHRGWNVMTTWRRIGAVEDDTAATVFAVENIPAYNYFDVAASYRLNKNLRFNFGIDNLANKKPPFIGQQQFAGNTLPATYDVIGRRFGLTVTWQQ